MSKIQPAAETKTLMVLLPNGNSIGNVDVETDSTFGNIRTAIFNQPELKSKIVQEFSHLGHYAELKLILQEYNVGSVKSRRISLRTENQECISAQCSAVVLQEINKEEAHRSWTSISMDFMKLASFSKNAFLHPRDFPWMLVFHVMTHATLTFSIAGVIGIIIIYFPSYYVKYNWKTSQRYGESYEGNWSSYILSSLPFYTIITIQPMIWSVAMIGKKEVLKIWRKHCPGPIGWYCICNFLTLFFWSPIIFEIVGLVPWGIMLLFTLCFPTATIRLENGRKSNFRLQIAKVCAVYFCICFVHMWLIRLNMAKLSKNCGVNCNLLVALVIFPTAREFGYSIIRSASYSLYGHNKGSEHSLVCLYQIFLSWYGRFLFTRFDSFESLALAVFLNGIVETVLRQTAYTRDKMVRESYYRIKAWINNREFMEADMLIFNSREYKEQHARMIISEMHSEYIAIFSSPFIMYIFYPLRMRYALGYVSYNAPLDFWLLTFSVVIQLISEWVVDSFCFCVEILQGFPVKEQWQCRYKYSNIVCFFATLAATVIFLPAFTVGIEYGDCNQPIMCATECFCKIDYNVMREYCIDLYASTNGTYFDLNTTCVG